MTAATTVDTTVGIGAVHCLLPERTLPVAELPELATVDREQAAFAAGCGVDTVGAFDDLTAGALAVQTCRELAVRGGGAADVLLLVGPRAPDVLLGSDVCRVQAEAGLDVTFALTVDGLGCTGSSAAWGLARDMLLADPARRGVLIAHASRPTGLDRVRFPVTVIGDGAFAMTVVRGGRPVLRAHRLQTDGAFHDLFTVDYKQTPWYEWREECASPDRYRFELALHSKLRLGTLVEQVLADAGVAAGDVRCAVMQNVTASAYEFYESLLGLEIHRVCRDNLASYGHLGAMDVVLNLDRLLRTGELAGGDLVLVLNNSPAAAWAATLWEV
jgi:3-oxoacyl-[acyl-carrier-protein] synthase-3